MAGTKAKKPSSSPSTSSGSCITKWISRLAVFFLFLAGCSWLDTIKDRFYVLDPQSLHELAQAAIAAAPTPTSTSFMVDYIISNLTATYPSSTIALNYNSSEWVFNNAGGAMGAMYIIHASITEYLIIFGTPLGTEGHTGLHTADDYFNILVGEQWAFNPPNLEKEVYPAGSVHHLSRGSMKQYKMHEGCFALEYARGWIPLMLPFGFADALTSTLDYKTLYYTVVYTGREIIRNLLIFKI
ncbi:C-8 sterol isomerase [Abortiporus biennis]|nr:C-8 sterol isomerase [Abortiporus biennis]